MPYAKWFISEDPFPDTLVIPLEDDFPDPRVLTEYLERPGAMLLVEPTKGRGFAKKAAEEQLREKIDEIRAHFGQIGCLRPNGSISWGKVVPSRISLDALIEWVADRSNRPGRPDYPDRPPDIDTPTNRCWIMHPVEVGSTASMIPPEKALESWPVYSLTLPTIDGSIIKVIISYISYKALGDDIPLALADRADGPGGVYNLRVKRERMNGQSTFDVDATIDEDEPDFWDKAEVLLSVAAEFADGDKAMIATYADYAGMVDETEVAVREMREYYAAEMLRRPQTTES